MMPWNRLWVLWADHVQISHKLSWNNPMRQCVLMSGAPNRSDDVKTRRWNSVFLLTMLTMLMVAVATASFRCGRTDASDRGDGTPLRHGDREGQEEARTLKLFSVGEKRYVMAEKIVRSDEEWRRLLTPEQYRVTRQRGTELACSGPYWDHHEDGVYQCVCCGTDLFDSRTKFESGTGWPSYFAPVARENIRLERDTSHFMERTEVLCARCDAHLGHVFDDGPEPTGLRYCMNSLALRFVARQRQHDHGDTETQKQE